VLTISAAPSLRSSAHTGRRLVLVDARDDKSEVVSASSGTRQRSGRRWRTRGRSSPYSTPMGVSTPISHSFPDAPAASADMRKCFKFLGETGLWRFLNSAVRYIDG